jgi:hypothetical protein
MWRSAADEKFKTAASSTNVSATAAQRLDKQDIGSRLRPSVHSATDRCKCNGKTQENPTFRREKKTDNLFE